MAVIGQLRSYHKKFLFAIEIDEMEIGWFTSMSALKGELGVVEQREGGSIVVADQSPGLLKHPALTLRVGVTDNDELYNWWNQIIDSEANAGAKDASIKRNLAVVEKDRDGEELRRWNVFETWMSSFDAGEFDANQEENLVNEVVLVYKYFKKA